MGRSMVGNPYPMPTRASKPRRRKPSARSHAAPSRRLHPRQSRRPRPAARPRRPAAQASVSAAHELELFVTLLRKCKRAVGGFSDEQKQRLRAIMAKAHRAIDRLHA